MEYFMNANHRKILLKEQEESLEIEYVFSSEDKNEINERIKDKNLNFKRKFKKR